VYSNGKVDLLPTSGYDINNLTTGNNQLWMTSMTPGAAGNIFNRIENPDAVSLLNTVAPLDKKRDTLVDQVETKFKEQTDVMTINRQTNDVINFFKTMFNIDGNTAHKARAQWGHLNEQIRSTQTQLDQMNSLEPVMQIAIGVLILIAVLYVAFGSTLGAATHIIAIIILGVGLFFILKFK
jgi:hypothetical protein